MKAFIFAAGYGTRNLPATKTVPKEIFPIFDKTAIDFILDECEDAGITDIVILTSRRKKALEDYFDREPELETILQNANKTDELALVRRATKFNVTFIRQHEMKGTGHALLTAKSALMDDAFVAFFPDDIAITISNKGGAKQLVEIYEKTKCCVLGAKDEYVNPAAYAVIEFEQKGDFSYVTSIIEKPKPHEITTNLVSLGRFVYTPDFLDALEKDYQNHKGGEFYPMGAMMEFAKEGRLVVHKIDGEILDIGNHASYLSTVLRYADSTVVGKKIIDEFVKNREN